MQWTEGHGSDHEQDGEGGVNFTVPHRTAHNLNLRSGYFSNHLFPTIIPWVSETKEEKLQIREGYYTKLEEYSPLTN